MKAGGASTSQMAAFSRFINENLAIQSEGPLGEQLFGVPPRTPFNSVEQRQESGVDGATVRLTFREISTRLAM